MAEVTLSGMTRLVCPLCGARLDCYIDLAAAGDRPEPGDWTACGTCLAVLVLDDGNKLRPPTAEESAGLSGPERADVARMLAAIRDVRAAAEAGDENAPATPREGGRGVGV